MIVGHIPKIAKRSMKDNENLNIVLFCIDYAQKNATLGVTKEQIDSSREWLVGLVVENELLNKHRELFINANSDKGLDW
jgi:hypothetical protein